MSILSYQHFSHFSQTYLGYITQFSPIACFHLLRIFSDSLDDKDFLHSADFWNLCAVFQINCVTWLKQNTQN